MVLIAGGCSSTTLGSGALNTSIQYNPPGNLYQSSPSVLMSTPRYGHRAVKTTGGIMVFGGISTIANPAIMVSSAELYSDTFHSWSSMPGASLATPRAFFGLATNGTVLVAAGNATRLNLDNSKTDSISTGTYQVLTLGPNTWGTEKSIVHDHPSWSAEFVQTDLVVSATSNKIVAGGININTGSNSYPVSDYFYTPSTDLWATVNGGPPYILNVLGSKEASCPVAITGADTIASFGGAISNDSFSSSFSGIANTDLVDCSGTNRLHPVPNFSSTVLANGRLKAVRSKYPISTVSVPSNSGFLYTANSLVPVLNLGGEDIIANPFQTTKIRLSTLSSEGSLLLVDQDVALPSFSPNNIVISQRSQYASVNSGSGIGTPLGLQLRTVGAKTKASSDALPQILDTPMYSETQGSFYNPEPVPPNGTVVGLRSNPVGGTNSTFLINNVFGNCKGIRGVIGNLSSTQTNIASDFENYSLSNKISLRSEVPVIVSNPVYIASPFKFSVTDTLNVSVDGDNNTKAFVIPMARKLGTNGTYQSPLSLKDADNSNKTISSAFGIDYNFNDFAIISRARVLTDASDTTKRILWRYYRFGEEGNSAAIRYVYPTSPNQPVSVSMGDNQDSFYRGSPRATIDVNVGSGALRKNRNISANTRLGVCKVSATGATTKVWSTYIFTGFTVTQGSRPVTNGETYLDIEFPSTLDDPGLNAGDVLWYEGASPTSLSLQNGQFKIKAISKTSPTSWRITIESYLLDNNALNDGTIWNAVANPGTISTDPNQKARFDDEVAVGDLVKIIMPGSAGSSLPSRLINASTMRIASIDANRQLIECYQLNPDLTTASTVVWTLLDKQSDLQIFALATTTASSLASVVNSDPNSPVSATITGTGLGSLTIADWDAQNSYDARSLFSDGVNYVKATNSPANTTLPTTFDLKLPVSSTLATNSDFTNEIFYLAPQLTDSVVQWLNTPAITGLWSVADVSSSENGTKVQIQTNTPGKAGSVFVQGGSANLKTASVIGNAVSTPIHANSPLLGMVLTTTKAESEGFCGNSWIELNNTSICPKITNEASPIWGNNNSVLSINSSGVFTFSSTPYSKLNLQNASLNNEAVFNVEKIGRYTTINIPKSVCQYSYANLSKLVAGNWLSIRHMYDSISPTNCGVFKILRFSQTEAIYTIWIDNLNSVDETAGAELIVLSDESPVVGDSLVINTDMFGEKNKGSWTIVDVGKFYTDTTITVSLDKNKTTSFSGNVPTLSKDIGIVEKAPTHGVKKLITISPNASNSDNVDLLIDDSGNLPLWNESAGTIVKALDKLDFPNSVKNGTDAYRYNSGLIAEVKRVIYGDSADPDNYSGYVSEGASVLIQGPTIKQIKLTLQVRLQSNTPNIDTIGAIKSAASGVINASEIGVPIAISDIISAVQGVNGVVAVSVISPEYSSVKDQIPVRGQEKAMVVDFENDIHVLVVGT